MTQIPNGRTEAEQALVQAKRQFEKLLLQFHQFLEDKTLPENKSKGQQDAQTDFVMRLLVAANELDVLNAPEGTMGLITLMIREGFVMRDNNNRLDYKIKLLQQEITKLKTQITDLSKVGTRSA